MRQTIAGLGGVMPEDLPTPAESVKQLDERERERLKQERQPRLFAPDSASSDGGL